MVTDPIAVRYAQALFDLAKRQGHVEQVHEQIEYLAALMHAHRDLSQFLLDPGPQVGEKVEVLGRVLPGGWVEETRAFVEMVLSMGRAEVLEEITEAFQGLVDVERGVVRVTVRSARPLSESVKATLAKRIERMEHRTVALTEETDPELIGGMQILLDHRILDGSVKTQLTQLRRRLKQVKVH